MNKDKIKSIAPSGARYYVPDSDESEEVFLNEGLFSVFVVKESELGWQAFSYQGDFDDLGLIDLHA